MDVDSAQQDGLSSQSDSQSSSGRSLASLADQHPANQGQSSSSQRTDQAPQINAVTELEKLEKFRFDGQEYTPKALKEAILRMKDYTQKTQEHSRTVESFKQEQKFYDNLWADLEMVRKDPNLATEFIKLYPEKFHSALKQVLTETNGQGSSSQTAKGPQIDVELHGRLAKLEKFHQEQEIAKNTTEINSLIDKYSKQFPKAIPKIAIADVFEAYNSGVTPTAETWEQAFKASEEYRKELVKQDYGELQKKQTVANAKARDVDSGGGTPGRAPKKFGSLKEVTEYAAETLGGR